MEVPIHKILTYVLDGYASYAVIGEDTLLGSIST
jgi:hypothetical protein